MNTDPVTVEPAPPPSLQPSESPPPEASAPATPFLAGGPGRANGKVARLPKSLRDQINNWLLDGVSYPDIIERLGAHGQDLKPDNLSQWKKRGHQDWLLQQVWLAETRARQEPASDLSADFDATHLNHAALQLGTLHIFEALRDLRSPADSPRPAYGRGVGGEGFPPSGPTEPTDAAPTDFPRPSDGNAAVGEVSPSGNSRTEPQNHVSDEACQTVPPLPFRRGEGRGEGSAASPSAVHGEGPGGQPDREAKPQNTRRRTVLDEKLGGDSAAFVRLLNALARASRETMLVQKYHDACARARAALRELKDPKRKLTEDERRHLILQVDEILGLPCDDPEPATGEPRDPAPIPSSSCPPATPTPI